MPTRLPNRMASPSPPTPPARRRARWALERKPDFAWKELDFVPTADRASKFYKDASIELAKAHELMRAAANRRGAS